MIIERCLDYSSGFDFGTLHPLSDLIKLHHGFLKSKWLQTKNVSFSGYKNDDPFGIEPNEHYFQFLAD